MPLAANLPVIDDRRFDDIVTEAKARIPRYTEEWTDFNDSDPGMTLVQLFAWMADMLLYRLGQVPDQNYLKFLELIGIELNPAQPAHGEITFPVLPTAADDVVIVPQHTQVTADSPAGGPPLVFETDEAVLAIRSSLDEVLSYDGFGFSSCTSANSKTQSFSPFGATAVSGCALYFGFNSANPFPSTTLDLAIWVQQSGGGTSVSDCSLPAAKVFAPTDLSWEYWNTNDWFPLNLLKDDTAGFQRSGHVQLKIDGTQLTQKAFSTTAPLYWIRAAIKSGGYTKAPVLVAVRTNTTAATQAQTVQNEILGGSDGSPNQQFTLANAPVLDGSLELTVDQGEGPQPWTAVNDLAGYDGKAQKYVLDRTTGSIRFGDGNHGAIPVANVNSPNDSIVAVSYRYGGGQQGNVPKGSLKSLSSSIAGVDDNGVTNLFDANGGQNEESLDEAKQRARRSLGSRCRAVTQSDFTYLATQVGGIKRAFALPLTIPAYPAVQIPGAVTVIVVPDADPAVANPQPSDGTLRSVCSYLNLRALITTELYVSGPKYQLVRVNVELIAVNTADLAQVKQDVQSSLTDFFHPLRGGPDGLGWPLGGTIFYSKVYQRVLSVAGVDRISSLTIFLDGAEQPQCKDVSINSLSLLYSNGHDVTPGYAF